MTVEQRYGLDGHQ